MNADIQTVPTQRVASARSFALQLDLVSSEKWEDETIGASCRTTSLLSDILCVPNIFFTFQSLHTFIVSSQIEDMSLVGVLLNNSDFPLSD